MSWTGSPASRARNSVAAPSERTRGPVRIENPIIGRASRVAICSGQWRAILLGSSSPTSNVTRARPIRRSPPTISSVRECVLAVPGRSILEELAQREPGVDPRQGRGQRHAQPHGPDESIEVFAQAEGGTGPSIAARGSFPQPPAARRDLGELGEREQTRDEDQEEDDEKRRSRWMTSHRPGSAAASRPRSTARETASRGGCETSYQRTARRAARLGLVLSSPASPGFTGRIT